MKNALYLVLLSIISGFLPCCTAHTYPYAYMDALERAYVSSNKTTDEYEPLQEGSEPELFVCDDIISSALKWKDEGYTIIGKIEITGRGIPLTDLQRFAERKSASVVLLSSSDAGSIREKHVLFDLYVGRLYQQFIFLAPKR